MLSGKSAAEIVTVIAEQAPNKKYGPLVERERKSGVENATTQLTTQFAAWPRLVAAARVWEGWISEAQVRMTIAQDIAKETTKR